jgi:hypothetical protein
MALRSNTEPDPQATLIAVREGIVGQPELPAFPRSVPEREHDQAGHRE